MKMRNRCRRALQKIGLEIRRVGEAVFENLEPDAGGATPQLSKFKELHENSCEIREDNRAAGAEKGVSTDPQRASAQASPSAARRHRAPVRPGARRTPLHTARRGLRPRAGADASQRRGLQEITSMHGGLKVR